MSKVSNAPAPTTRIQGSQKVAAILLAISKEVAARVLGRFNEDDLRRLAESAVDLDQLDSDRLKSISKEFEAGIRLGPGLSVSVDEVSDLLRSGVTEDRAKEIISGIRHQPNPTIWTRIAQLPVMKLASFLELERPCTIAYVLSELTPEFAGSVLERLKPDLRSAVLRASAALRPISQQVGRQISLEIERELLLEDGRFDTESNLQRIAQICGVLGTDDTTAFIDYLDSFDPEASTIIRQNIFSFEDLQTLTPTSMTRVVEALTSDVIVRDNWQLSVARAYSTLKLLVRNGLSESRIDRIEGYADRNPTSPERDAPDNRRIEILLQIRGSHR